MSQDNNFSQASPAVGAERVLALTFVMLGLTFFSASMWTGGTLGTGLSYHDFFLAVLIGNLSSVFTLHFWLHWRKTGLTTHLLARFVCVKGSWLPSLLLGGTQLAGLALAWRCFYSGGKATGLDINLLIAVSGLLMTVTVFFGISALTVLSGDCGSGYRLPLAVIPCGWPLTAWAARRIKAVVPAQPLDFKCRAGAGCGVIHQCGYAHR